MGSTEILVALLHLYNDGKSDTKILPAGLTVDCSVEPLFFVDGWAQNKLNDRGVEDNQ